MDHVIGIDAESPTAHSRIGSLKPGTNTYVLAETAGPVENRRFYQGNYIKQIKKYLSNIRADKSSCTSCI